MALGVMYITVTCPTLGANIGPFNLYSDVDGYTSAFEVGITGAQLTAGFFTQNAPVGTTIVMVQSTGACTNSALIPITGVPTTTTTSTLALMYPVVGTCCGLVGTEYFPYNPMNPFSVGDIVAGSLISSSYFGGWEVTGPPVPAVQTLVLFDNTNYFSCPNYLAIFAGVSCM